MISEFLKSGMKLSEYVELYEGKYESLFDIGETVEFTPMYRHLEQYSIKREKYWGTITATRFTAGKVFYDIVDDYWGHLFEGVDSGLVEPDSTTGMA
jgi:hypothetical protein